MRVSLIAGSAVLAAQTALAGGLDRSGQPIGIIFEQGNYAELSFGMTSPDLTGTDLLANPISDVGGAFSVAGGGIKYQFSDKFSAALIFDQPYGADITYGGSPATTMLGGTSAMAHTSSVTAVGRYQFSDRFSAHAGIRHQTISGDITLSGLAYGGLSGYNVALGGDSSLGFVVGGAFEIPEMALRVALTYNSEITHDLPSVETIGGFPLGVSADTEVKSPASINLDFQSGINPKTLVFGSVRYVKWSDLIISPTFFDALVAPGTPNSSISDLEDTVSYSLGIGRKINDALSLSIAYGWEPGGDDDLVSPLAPSNGYKAITLGAKYRKDAVTITGGIRYTWLGDAMPETGTPDVARASFTDNTALSVGMKIGFHF